MKKNILRKVLMASALSVLIAGGTSGYAGAQAQDAEASNRGAILLLESVKESYLASQRLEAIQAKNTATDEIRATGPASSWLTKVNPEEVNMVTNRYEKKAQSEISVNGRSYYGSGEGMALNLRENPTTRFAKDPLTNQTVDKSEAVIYADASGRVLYFESEDTYKGFIDLASPETVYGYSEAK